ncbi:MAG: DNA glycosylase [Oscillospiraceae bacterium]
MAETEVRVLCSTAEMDIVKTFECGQCFRWNADEEGTYWGIAMGCPAKLWVQGDTVYIKSPGDMEMWREYFDLDRNYREISRSFDGGEYLFNVCKLRLRHPHTAPGSWEALCSFIISKCNNITGIKGIVERLCSNFGRPVEFEGRTFYTFPSAAQVAELPAGALDVLRCGYRAPYISAAAIAVASGALDLNSLIKSDSSTAKRSLMALPGIGEKVANCVVLFGLNHMEAFPIDVWIRRALKEHFPQDFDPACLGDCGLAQQYIFYYARSTGDGK